MGNFSEVLSGLMDRYGKKSCDIYEPACISKSYFSKIKNGKVLPPKEDTFFTAVADAIGLSDDDRDVLYSAFHENVLDENERKVREAVSSIFRIADYYSADSGYSAPAADSLSSGCFIGNRSDAGAALAAVFKGSCVYVLFDSVNPEHYEIIRNQMVMSGANVKWTLILEKARKNSSSLYNTQVFSRMMNVVLRDNCEVRYIYSEEMNKPDAAFPYIFVSDRAAFSVNKDCTQGVFTEDSKIIDIYLKNAAAKFDSAQPYAAAFSHYSDFCSQINFDHMKRLAGGKQDRKHKVYVVAKHPCIIFGCSSNDIHRYIREKEFAQTYIEWLKSSYDLFSEDIIFTRKGLEHITSAPEYYEFHRNISHSVPLDVRMLSLLRMVKYCESNNEITPLVSKDEFIYSGSINWINIFPDGRMLIVADLGDEYRILVTFERSIADTFVQYFEKMKENGVIAGRDESLAEMERYIKYN